MQVHPGAPGTARQGRTRIIVLTNDGGNATQPRAPGHERPRAALRAARHGRLSAATGAPGADVPPATKAGAPGQYCLSAAPRAPGHGRPLAITAGAPGHDRLSAAPTATVPSPAGPRRLRQECLPRVPANPRTLTYMHARQDTAHTRTVYRRATRYAQSRRIPHQAHPAIQIPPRPRSCSTAATGFSFQHPSRAPPPRPSAEEFQPCQRATISSLPSRRARRLAM